MTQDERRLQAIVEALHGVALFGGLPETELAALAGRVIRKRYERDAVIFAQGDYGDGLYIVVRGHVGISRQSNDGGELLLTLAGPGEYLGDLALFDGAPRSAAATALDDCRVLFLPRDAFRAFLESHPAVLWTCLGVLVGQVRRLTALADDIALRDLRGRLAHGLLRLVQHGDIPADGAPPSSHGSYVHMTQQHLANMLGATRERVNKHLRAFAAEGLIALEHGQVRILDRAGLERIGAGDA